MILAGYFEPGKKIGEMVLAERLAVSRTPIRLALQIIEKEGLLLSAPRRGFTVREFTIDEVVDAIDVRGHLEGMAARLAAEHGLDVELAARIRRCIAEATEIVEAESMNDEDRARWVESNRCFHASLVEASGNAVLAASIEHVARLPLVPPSAIIFDTSDPVATRQQMEGALADHRAVFDAINKRQGCRAEALMREHAYRSRDNKRHNIGVIKTHRRAIRLPGLDLISAE
jgi:GntR family transcriptional regulator of vanillate catabolism